MFSISMTELFARPDAIPVVLAAGLIVTFCVQSLRAQR